MCDDRQVKEITARVVEYSEQKFGESLKDVILFGSHARGDFDDESDIDKGQSKGQRDGTVLSHSGDFDCQLTQYRFVAASDLSFRTGCYTPEACILILSEADESWES
jgi:hypothetical protein